MCAVRSDGAKRAVTNPRAVRVRCDPIERYPQTKAEIYAQRSWFAADETTDRGGREAVGQAFVTGFRSVLWVTAGLALLNLFSAVALVKTGRPTRDRPTLVNKAIVRNLGWRPCLSCAHR